MATLSCVEFHCVRSMFRFRLMLNSPRLSVFAVPLVLCPTSVIPNLNLEPFFTSQPMHCCEDQFLKKDGGMKSCENFPQQFFIHFFSVYSEFRSLSKFKCGGQGPKVTAIFQRFHKKNCKNSFNSFSSWSDVVISKFFVMRCQSQGPLSQICVNFHVITNVLLYNFDDILINVVQCICSPAENGLYPIKS